MTALAQYAGDFLGSVGPYSIFGGPNAMVKLFRELGWVFRAFSLRSDEGILLELLGQIDHNSLNVRVRHGVNVLPVLNPNPKHEKLADFEGLPPNAGERL